MTSVPTSLAATAWALLAGLAVLVILVYRQLAYQLRMRPRNTTSKLELGEPAPDFPFAASDRADRARHLREVSTPTLLVFADPYCMSCEKLLESVAAECGNPDDASLRLLVATEADTASVGTSPAFGRLTRHLAFVDRGVPTRLYHIPGTPYAFAIGGDGLILAHGSPQTGPELRALLGRFDNRTPALAARPGTNTIDVTYHNGGGGDEPVQQV